LSGEIAHAPDYFAFNMQSISELDKELTLVLPPLKHLDVDLDLSVLTSALSASDQIIEEDVQWTKATFTQLLHGE
jgi:hypothetical protein